MPKFDKNGVAIIKNAESKYGLININGEMSVPLKYQEIEVLSLNKIKALRNNKWETINL